MKRGGVFKSSTERSNRHNPVSRLLWCGLILALVSLPGNGGPEPDSGSTGNRAGYRKTRFSYKAPDGQGRERTLYLWYPTSDEPHPVGFRLHSGSVATEGAISGGRHPLVIFSHGYRGSGDQVLFLTESLARAGYIVAAVNHADSLAEHHFGQQQEPPKFLDAKSWDDRKFRDRQEDMVALLDHLLAMNREAGSTLADHIQEDVIGVMGHSLGGYTALGLAGAWPSWREPRLRSALLLSPYSMPFVEGRPLDGVRLPTMLQGGTRDVGITPFLPPIYAKLPAPKYFLVLKEEGHFAWTNFLNPGKNTAAALDHPGPAKLIVDYSVAFFDKTLRGRTVPLLREPNSALASYRFQEP